MFGCVDIFATDVSEERRMKNASPSSAERKASAGWEQRQ
jgi:hypothetical protein